MPRLAKALEEQLLKNDPDLRAQGLRPELIWVHDPDAPVFRDAMRRQIEAINPSPDEAEIMDLTERVSDWPND